MELPGQLVPFIKYLTKLLCITLVVTISLSLSIYFRTSLPNATSCKQDSTSHFITKSDTICVNRARQLLSKFSDAGPKPIGSYSNEVTIPKMILDELQSISVGIRSNVSLDIDFQIPTYYENVDNIVARLSKNGTKSKALLINSHYDSAKEGPGASDDGINVVVMLEVLRSLTADRNLEMECDIIFLFNDGEESGLLGSYEFVTNHKWAKDVIAFINLEAMGSGGREMLFQATSKKLMNSYIKTASYPFTTVFGQEIFQSGVVPSVTDFQIFQEYLNVGGLDFAFIENGYVYHTKYDTSDKNPNESIFVAGNNLLMLVRDFVKKFINENATQNDDS